ncbi:MAG: hypothetical protein H7318_08050 [Oligoflexus sp.]|nr:hypothetical protein [Oligoflexus sp.]
MTDKKSEAVFVKVLSKILDEEVARNMVEGFDGVITQLTADIHWVYCAYLLLDELEVPDAKSLTEKQRRLTSLVNKGPWEDCLSRIIAAKTQCGRRKSQETLLRMALQHATAL